jgi:hypothetical protein
VAVVGAVIVAMEHASLRVAVKGIYTDPEGGIVFICTVRVKL